VSTLSAVAKGRDLWVPAFEVRVNERKAAADVVHDVMSVTYRDSLKDLDTFDLVLNNWDAEKRRFKYLDGDDRRWDPGEKLDISMGYRDRAGLSAMLTGVITSLRPAFPASGAPTLTVSGVNVLQQFRRKPVSKTYVGKTDSDIAREICKRLRVDVVTKPRSSPPEPKLEYVIQDNRMDIVFLFERARRIGYDLFVKERPAQGGSPAEPEIHFVPPESVERTTYKLVWGGSLTAFSPSLKTGNQVSSVRVRGWDRVRNKQIDVVVELKNLPTQALAARGGRDRIESMLGEREEIVGTIPVHDATEARAVALSRLALIHRDMVTATGATVGLPDLRAGSRVEVVGVGERFSGSYFVTSTTHTLSDSGYTTQFECRREESRGG
jgi:phage protein D